MILYHESGNLANVMVTNSAAFHLKKESTHKNGAILRSLSLTEGVMMQFKGQAIFYAIYRQMCKNSWQLDIQYTYNFKKLQAYMQKMYSNTAPPCAPC